MEWVGGKEKTEVERHEAQWTDVQSNEGRSLWEEGKKAGALWGKGDLGYRILENQNKHNKNY